MWFHSTKSTDICVFETRAFKGSRIKDFVHRKAAVHSFNECVLRTWWLIIFCCRASVRLSSAAANDSWIEERPGGAYKKVGESAPLAGIGYVSGSQCSARLTKSLKRRSIRFRGRTNAMRPGKGRLWCDSRKWRNTPLRGYSTALAPWIEVPAASERRIRGFHSLDVMPWSRIEVPKSENISQAISGSQC